MEVKEEKTGNKRSRPEFNIRRIDQEKLKDTKTVESCAMEINRLLEGTEGIGKAEEAEKTGEAPVERNTIHGKKYNAQKEWSNMTKVIKEAADKTLQR